MPSRRPRRHAPSPTAVSLRRWLCAWLALLLVTQTIGATGVGLRGTWHWHWPSRQASAPPTPAIRWQHGDAARDAHAQWHASGQAHDHALTDSSVVPLGPDTTSEAVAVLAVTLAPAAEMRWALPESARHVQTEVTPWAATSRTIAPPLKPPRA